MIWIQQLELWIGKHQLPIFGWRARWGHDFSYLPALLHGASPMACSGYSEEQKPTSEAETQRKETHLKPTNRMQQTPRLRQSQGGRQWRGIADPGH